MTTEEEPIWNRELRTDDELERAYRALGDDGARSLARRAVESVERRDGDRDRAVGLLASLACFAPWAAEGLHGRLLDADVLASFTYPYVLQLGVMFRSADPETRDRLVALAAAAPTEKLGSNALSALAWIDDEEVPRALLRFHEHPPPWASEWFSATRYPLLAGWALLQGGRGRPLMVSPRCHRLERGTEAEAASPVVVIARLEQSCGGCSGPLTVLLDLDLGDERLGFLELAGQSLRVLTCERCVCFGTVYAEVDLGGAARWMDESPRQDDPPEWSYLPERQLGLGLERRTPFEAHAFATHMSQLGGQAGWIQNPDYPPCPRCGEPMPSLAQVDLGEFELCEGMIYAFLHVGCGVVATCFQQT